MSAALLAALGGRSDAFVRLDFETYYDAQYSLKNKKMTTESYVRDPRFETIGVGVKVGSAPSVWMEDADFRRWAAAVDWSRVTLMAHHAQFDGLVLSHHYDIRPRFWICTLSMGRALHGSEVGGSLAALSEHYGVGQKGHEVDDAKGKRRRDFTPEEWLRYGAYCNNDVELMDRLFWKMRPRLPVTELWLVDMTVRMFTEPVFVANRAVLDEALKEEKAKKRAVLLRVAQTSGAQVPTGADEATVQEAARAVLSSGDKFAALLRSLGQEPPLKPNDKGEMIYAFAKDDPGMQTLLEHPDDEIRALAEARVEVKSTLVGTRTERLIGVADRGAVPFYLKIYGAHTHRWSGGDKMNPQNFNRGGGLRAAIEAPEGHTLAVADSGQIEARVVAWLAGEAHLLETFRRNDATGGDFYSDVGGSFFGKKLSKKETPIERQLSKSMVLGLGFGMGWGKFSTELLKGMLGAPPVQFGPKEAAQFGVNVAAFEVRPWGRQPQPKPGEPPPEPVTCGGKVEELITFGARLPYADLLVHCAVTDHFVRLYRRTNSRITKLWDAMEGVLAEMARPEEDGGKVRMTFGPLKVVRHGLVKPNGLVMRYPELRRGKSGFSYMGGKGGRERVHVYGGLMTENAVQSLARDIVAEQALWIRAGGYRIGTTTHDEVVSVPRTAEGPACLAYMLERMKIAPEWCRDLPLNAEGGIARSYGAVK